MFHEYTSIPTEDVFASGLKLGVPEADRLAALHRLDILDTDPEPEFDELVQFAASLCEAPSSLLTLIDEHRQWFKAAFGINMQQTPRDVAFCNYTIQQRGLMLVPDATLDHRFTQNPLVTSDPNVRFYAGVPICSPDGFPLGSLCVLDYVPRTLSAPQARALQLLSQQVNARIHLRAQRLLLKQALDSSRAINLKLQHLATTDPLTGLFNRRSFDERHAAEFARAHSAGLPLSVLLIDVDNFKQLNDSLGHDAGDRALKILASLLRDLTRPGGMPVRYGGEEFLVLLPGVGESETAQFAHTLLEAVRNHPWPDRQITVSIGSSSLGPSISSPEHLIRLSDEALYIAKRSGKDRLVVHGAYFDNPGISAAQQFAALA